MLFNKLDNLIFSVGDEDLLFFIVLGNISSISSSKQLRIHIPGVGHFDEHLVTLFVLDTEIGEYDIVSRLLLHLDIGSNLGSSVSLSLFVGLDEYDNCNFYLY